MSEEGTPFSEPEPPPGKLADASPPAGEIDLARVHGSILHEHDEPAEGCESVPLWLVALIMMLVFWGGFYLAVFSGGFRADVFNPSEQSLAIEPTDPATLGRRIYLRNCALCHQPDGRGVPGYYPPLAGSEWVLAQNGRGDSHLVALVLHGLQGPARVNGGMYNGSMPPWRFLRDDEVAAVINYIRGEWGNAAPSIDGDFVSTVRAQTRERMAPFSESELLSLPIGRAPAAKETLAPPDAKPR